MATKKRRLHKFRLSEVSSVDVPAQTPATVAIMKSHDGSIEKLKPGKGEKKDDFVARFMADEKMKTKYPDQKQRLAVAYSMLERKGKTTMKKRAMLTGIENDHQHVIELDWVTFESGQKRENFSGNTSYNGENGKESHSHPWIMTEEGEIVIGLTNGHTHTAGQISKVADPEPEPEPVIGKNSFVQFIPAGGKNSFIG